MVSVLPTCRTDSGDRKSFLSVPIKVPNFGGKELR